MPLSPIKRDRSNTLGNFLKGFVLVGPGGDRLMIFGQNLKLVIAPWRSSKVK